jgi:hypothetical protein
MGLKKTKRPRIGTKPREVTVILADLVREYNLILDKKSNLSKSERDLVCARIEKLKERGLVKLQTQAEADQQPIEEQVAQIINGSNQKDVN